MPSTNVIETIEIKLPAQTSSGKESTTQNIPRGRAGKSAVAYSLNQLTAVSGVGSSLPALATCETSQVLLAVVPGGLSRGPSIFAPPTDWPLSCELK